jgi:hypothetical protein
MGYSMEGYVYLHYQKKTRNNRWINESARIPKTELVMLARKILARKELFNEILNLMRD